MTDKPLTARERARLKAKAQQPDERLEAPVKTPRVRRGQGSGLGRTRQRARRTAKVVEMFPDKARGFSLDRDREDVVPPVGKGKGEERKRRAPTLGARWSEVADNIKQGLYTWDDFVQQLTPEELARGQLMDTKGRFTGRPPEWVPRAFLLECQREIYRRFNEKMQERLLGATEEYIDLSRMVDDPNVREKMLRYLIERVMGPVPKEVVVTQEKPWEVIVTDIVSEAPADAEHGYEHREGGQ